MKEIQFLIYTKQFVLTQLPMNKQTCLKQVDIKLTEHNFLISKEVKFPNHQHRNSILSK